MIEQRNVSDNTSNKNSRRVLSGALLIAGLGCAAALSGYWPIGQTVAPAILHSLIFLLGGGLLALAVVCVGLWRALASLRQQNAAIAAQHALTQPAAQQVENLRAFVQRVIDVIPQPVYVKDAQGRYIMVNKALCERRHQPPEVILGKTVVDLNPGASDRLSLLEDMEVLKGRVVSKEESNPHPFTNEPRYLLVTKEPSQDEYGNPVVIGVNFDITELRVSQQELRAHAELEKRQTERVRAFVQRLIDIIPQPVYVKDAEGSYIIINKAFCERRGKTAEEMLGKTIVQISGRKSSELAFAEDLEVLNGRFVQKEEIAAHPLTNTPSYLLVTKAPSEDEFGNPVIVGASFDITELRISQQELRAQAEMQARQTERVRAFVQRLIDVIPQPVYVKDAQSRYIVINKAFCRRLQKPAEEILGKSGAQLISPAEGAIVSAEDAEVLAGRAVSKEILNKHPVTGLPNYMQVTKAASEDEHGNPVVVGTNFDITDVRQAEQELRNYAEQQARQAERVRAFVQRLIDVIPQPVYVKDAHGQYVIVNRAFCERRRISPEEAIGKTIVDLTRAGEGNASLVEDMEVLKGLVVSKEQSLPHPITGKANHLLVTKAPSEDEYGNPVVVGANFDITELREAEKELRAYAEQQARQAERVRAFVQRLIDVIPQPVYVKDAQGRYIIVNKAFCERREKTAAQILGKNVVELTGRASSPAALAEDMDVLRGRIVSKEQANPHPLTGKIHYLVVTKAPSEDEYGNPVVVGANFDITELREAEQELRAYAEQQARQAERVRAFVQRLIDVIPQPVYVKDAQGRYIIVNKAFCDRRRKSPEEILGRTAAQLVDPTVGQRVLDEDLEVLKGLMVSKEDMSIHPATGEVSHLLVTKAPSEDEYGNPVVVGANFDITSLRLAEQELRAYADHQARRRIEVQAFVQRLLDVIPYAVFIKDKEGRYTQVNEGFCTQYGAPMSQILGRTAQELSNKDRGEMISQEDMDVINGLRVYKEEDHIGTLTGKRVRRIVAKGACLDDTGQPVIIGTQFDITELRRTEQELRESEARWQFALEGAGEGVWDWDVVASTVYLSPRWKSMLGHTEDEIGNDLQEWRARVHADDMEHTWHALSAHLEGAAPLFVSEHRMRCKDGSYIWTLDRGKVVERDTAGKALRVIGTLADISERKAAEVELKKHRDRLSELVAEQTHGLLRAKEAAEHASEAKSQFLANMSHELRTPMHAVLSFASLGHERYNKAEPEKLRDYFLRIKQSGDRLMLLLNNLLDLSKLEAGGMYLDLRPIRLEAIVADACNEFEALIAARQLDVRVVTEADAPSVCVDATRMGQVVRNLLSNAIKFTPEGRGIELRITRSSLPVGRRAEDGGTMDATALCVADEGVGIPPEELEQVFDKFIQSTRTLTGAGGTGLGLAICREIVAAHRGHISAHNRAGGGTEFVVILPAQTAEQ